MNQRTASLAVLVVAAMAVVAVPAAGLAPGGIGASQDSAGDATEVEANGTNAQAAANASENASVPPGSQLTGIVGVQKAEIEGEIESRGFAIALNRSDNASSRAAVVAKQVTDLNATLERLRERKAELDAARDNGTITEGEYRARIAEVGARIATVQRLANRTENAARNIPEAALRERGVSPDAIGELGRNARNLSGPEVAAVARQIAGPGAGKGLGRGPPANLTGPPGSGLSGLPGDGVPGAPGSDDDNKSDTPGNGPSGANGGIGVEGPGVTGSGDAEAGASASENGAASGSETAS